MNQNTVYILIAIETVGVATTLAVGIGAIVAWRRTKRKVEKISSDMQEKTKAIVAETERFLASLRAI